MRITINLQMPAYAPQQQTLQLPVGIGSISSAIPNAYQDQATTPLILLDPKIAPLFAWLTEQEGQVELRLFHAEDRINVNGQATRRQTLSVGDHVELGDYRLEVLGFEQGNAIAAPQQTDSGVGASCQRLVGVLFPRVCGRQTATDCPHCDGMLDSSGNAHQDDPYFLNTDRLLYPNYGHYRQNDWGSEYYTGELRPLDFTDADAASLQMSGADFEQDTSAS